jgi:hypothetical protein
MSMAARLSYLSQGTIPSRHLLRRDIPSLNPMRFAPAAALFAAALSLAATSRAQQTKPCPAPPALTASSQRNIFTPQQELDLGEIEAEALEKDFRVIHDDEIAARLNDTVNRILAQVPPTQLKFRVALIDLPTLDSFSIGASRIYLSRKLVAFLRNDDELAGLLSHEMGHILTHQHGADMTRMFHEVLGVDSVGDRKDILDKYNRMQDTIARDKKVLNRIADWRRREEEPEQYEADRVALYAVAAARYSPQSYVDFFDRLAQTHGKTGNWLSDAFGTTQPDQKRLREIRKSLAQLPPDCSQIAAPPASAEFLEWQSDVIAYSGLNHPERLVGVVAKKPLEPPLRIDITNMKFSPDGTHALAQDESSIFVFAISARIQLPHRCRRRSPGSVLARFAENCHPHAGTPR